MKRELKRQIKQDELVTGLERAAAWIREHAREVQVTLITVVVLVGAGLVVNNFRDRQARAAESAFANALQTFHAPVTAELAEGAERPAGPVFATREEKFRKALSELEAVQKQAAGAMRDRARYYTALCRIELGDLAGAEKTLSELATRKDPDAPVPSLARLALADLHRRAGRLDKATDAYRQMLEDSSFSLPRDHVLMRLAAVQEEANRMQEARASYVRLTQEYPASVYAAEARQRAEYLRPSQG